MSKCSAMEETGNKMDLRTFQSSRVKHRSVTCWCEIFLQNNSIHNQQTISYKQLLHFHLLIKTHLTRVAAVLHHPSPELGSAQGFVILL